MPRFPVPTEREFVTRLCRGEFAFPPLELTWEKPSTSGIDAGVRMTWQEKAFRFAAEYKMLSNPKTVVAAAEQAWYQSQTAELLPLVVVPFLDEEALDTLESRSVSGIDLCGNGVVIVPGEWAIRRTGNPNLFRAEGVIKNVYRKNSSVVARLFLAKYDYDSVRDAMSELRRRGGQVTLSTVSKVCKRLEEDLVIERKRDGMTSLRLIQPEKLLDLLVANYSPPVLKTQLSGKLRGIEPSEFRRQLLDWAETTGNLVALSGASSVSAYAVMGREEMDEFYCTDAAGAACFLNDRFQLTEWFATVRLLETRNEEVYFDRSEDLTASPVQTFLELSNGDKRDRETADQVRKLILSTLNAAR